MLFMNITVVANFHNLDDYEIEEICAWGEAELDAGRNDPNLSGASSKANRGLYCINNSEHEEDGSSGNEDDKYETLVFTVSDFDSGESFMSAYEKSVLNPKSETVTVKKAKAQLFATNDPQLYRGELNGSDKDEMELLEEHFKDDPADDTFADMVPGTTPLPVTTSNASSIVTPTKLPFIR